MSTRLAIREMVDELFNDWCQDGGDASLDCLMDYVYEWAESGDGIRACNGDWSTYLLAIIGIINRWHEQPGFTDKHLSDSEMNARWANRPNSVFGKEGQAGYEHLALNRFWFDDLVFRYKHER